MHDDHPISGILSVTIEQRRIRHDPDLLRKLFHLQKAEKWLKEHQIVFEKRPIREMNPTIEELQAWQAASGLPLRRFFNTSGQLYRTMNLKERLQEMSEHEMLELLASDGMLVRRPLLIDGNRVLVGFTEKEWAAALL